MANKHRKEQILVVAKDEELRQELQETLESAGGYVTNQAGTFEEALSEVLLVNGTTDEFKIIAKTSENEFSLKDISISYDGFSGYIFNIKDVTASYATIFCRRFDSNPSRFLYI